MLPPAWVPSLAAQGTEKGGHGGRISQSRDNPGHDTQNATKGAAAPSLHRGARPEASRLASPQAEAIDAPTRRRQATAEAPREGDPTPRDGVKPALATGPPRKHAFALGWIGGWYAGALGIVALSNLGDAGLFLAVAGAIMPPMVALEWMTLRRRAKEEPR